MKHKLNISRLSLIVLTFWSVLFVSGCSQGVSVEDYERLSSQLNEAQSKVIELQNENSVQAQQIKQAQDNLMILQNEIFTLKQQIADLNEDNKWLRDEITNLINKLIPATPPTPIPTPAPTPTPTKAQPLALAFTTTLAPDSSEYLMVYKPMLDEIERKSSGRIKFNVFFSGSLVPATEQYDAITRGVADMGVSYFSYIAVRFPLSDAFTFPAAYSMTSASQDLIQALGNHIFALAPSETKILCYFYQQPHFLYTAHKQVRTLEDLKGLKLRATGTLQIATLSSLEAVPVAVPSAEIYTAIQKGLIEGALVAPSLVDSLKMTDFVKFGLRLPLGYTVGIIHINANTWSKIPADLKPILEDAAGQAHENFVQQFNMDDAKVNSILTGQGGTVYTPSTTQRTQWANAIKPVITQWIGNMESKGFPAQDMLNTIRIESQQRGVPFPY